MKYISTKRGRALLAAAILTTGGLLTGAAALALPTDAEHDCPEATSPTGDDGSVDDAAPAGTDSPGY